MKVTHWAAAVGVSLGVLAGSPVYAQYPLHGPTTAQVVPVAPGYGHSYTPGGTVAPDTGVTNIGYAEARQYWSTNASQFANRQQVASPQGAKTQPVSTQQFTRVQIQAPALNQPSAHSQHRSNAFDSPIDPPWNGVPANVQPANPPARNPQLGVGLQGPRHESRQGIAPGGVAFTQQPGPGTAQPATRLPMPAASGPAGSTALDLGQPVDHSLLPQGLPDGVMHSGDSAYSYHPQRRRRHHAMRGDSAPNDYTSGWSTEVQRDDVTGGESFGFAVGGAEACCEPPPPRSPWYGSYSSLLLTRDNENEVWFSYDSATVGSQILGSLDAQMGWRFGVDVRLGKYLDDGHHSVELVYFGVLSARKEANVYGADMVGNLDASLTFDSLSYDPGGGATSVASLFNTAERHQLLRSYRAHNFEINSWRHCVDASCGKDGRPAARMSWMMGFRYMNYSEGFHFAADPYDRTFGNQSQEELRYDSSVNNHLLGLQVGGMGEFCLNDRWQFTSTVKAGVMANRMDLTSFIGSIHRSAYVDNVASPFDGQRWNVRSTKNDVSLLGELDLGMRYRWSDSWNITSGYRAIGLSGVGLATNQVPNYFADLGAVRQIDSNASLILHGVAYLGAEYNY